MSDKAAFRDSFQGHPECEADALDVPLSSTRCDSSDEADSVPAPSAVVYGPAPRPVPQPVIFDRIYNPSMGGAASLPSLSDSPSFNLSAQSSASIPVNTVSFQPGNHGEPLWSHPTKDPSGSESAGSMEAGAEEATTVSVESQCDSPSLDDLAEMDISEASREELMVYHSELMGWIRELEQALQGCQSDFKVQLHQYGQQEQLLEHRTQEFLALQERYVALNQEVDIQQKTHQRQTILVETLQDQLSSSQERVAQMERDFSQVQRRCSDQAQQLLQAERLCRDLKSRLGRQQRHTMQFKAALEKSLAVSVNDSDYDLGDVEMDPMDSSGELFPRPKPVQPWSNQLDEAALSQALNGLDQPVGLEQPGVTKGLNLQLAFEDPEAADLKAAQTKVASKAQLAYGNAAMGFAASHMMAKGNPVEPVFDPEKAEDLEATLKQESDSILQGDLLGSVSKTASEDTSLPHQAPLVSSHHKVAFVPPITPVLPEEVADRSGLLDEAEPGQAVAAVQAGGDSLEATAPPEKKRATLAGINLPNFPKF